MGSWDRLACQTGRLTKSEKECNRKHTCWRVQHLSTRVRDGYSLGVKDAGYCGVDKKIVADALRELPERRGTANDVHAQIQKVHGASNRLDQTIASGTKTIPRWRNITSMILATHSGTLSRQSLFTREKAPGKRYVYQLRDDVDAVLELPAKRARKSRKEGVAALNRVKAFGTLAGR